MKAPRRFALVAALLTAPSSFASPKHSRGPNARTTPRATPTPTFECDWCQSYLRITHEPTLVGDATEDEAYRVIYSPSFGHPFVVRIDCTTNDLMAYVFDREPPGAGYDEDELTTQVIKSWRSKVAAADCDAVRDKIERTNFWTMPEQVFDAGADGYYLVLESHSDSRYHRVIRWEGGPKPFRDAAGKILQLGGIDSFGDEPAGER